MPPDDTVPPPPIDSAAVPAAAYDWQKVAGRVAVVVVLVLVAASFYTARKPTAQLGDFGAYYRGGQAVAAGRSPYTLDPRYGALGAYMYCPAFCYVACRPLGFLSYVPSMRTFLTANWLVTVAAVALSVHLLRVGRAVPIDWPALRSPTAADPNRGGAFWAGLIGCAASGTYLWSDLHNGQVGTLLLLACLGWLALTLAGWPVLGGVCLSLAVGLKLYPMLLAPYLLLRRQWWPGLIGLAIGLVLQFFVPAPFARPAGLLALHEEWLRFLMKTQVPWQTIRSANQSLLGVLARTPSVSDGWDLFSQARLDALQHVYPVIVVVLTLALYGGLFLRRARDPVADVSILLIWMTVAGPRAWTFNFAAEIPAAILLGAAIVARRPRWPLAAVALVAVWYGLGFPTNPPFLAKPTRWTLGTQILYDKHITGAVLLAIAVAAVDLGRARADTRTEVAVVPAGDRPTAAAAAEA